jgi:hypothetical protein
MIHYFCSNNLCDLPAIYTIFIKALKKDRVRSTTVSQGKKVAVEEISSIKQ